MIQNEIRQKDKIKVECLNRFHLISTAKLVKISDIRK